jgi:thiol-disulfide isomerase/thioredoxin
MNFKIKYALVAVFFVTLLSCKTDKEKTTIVEDNADSKTTNNDGKTAIETYDFAGFEKFLKFKNNKTYVINFWATWCKPCVAELPHFEELYKNYKDKNVEVILVSLDFPKKINESLIPFIEENKLKSRVILLDDSKQNEWIPKVDKNWSGAIPATVIYNKNVKGFYEQSFTYAELEEQLNKFLN